MRRLMSTATGAGSFFASAGRMIILPALSESVSPKWWFSESFAVPAEFASKGIAGLFIAAARAAGDGETPPNTVGGFTWHYLRPVRFWLVILFFVAFFPLFLRVGSSRSALVAMMARVTAISFLFQAGLVLAGNAVAIRLKVMPWAPKTATRLAGVALLGFGIKLAASNRCRPLTPMSVSRSGSSSPGSTSSSTSAIVTRPAVAINGIGELTETGDVHGQRRLVDRVDVSQHDVRPA